MMIVWRSVQRSNMDASLSMGCSAAMDSDGVMMIENGHVTMVASGWISSLAIIENPDETNDSIQLVRKERVIDIARTHLMRTVLLNENSHRETRTIL